MAAPLAGKFSETAFSRMLFFIRQAVFGKLLIVVAA
jgi:hypothetical protein